MRLFQTLAALMLLIATSEHVWAQAADAWSVSYPPRSVAPGEGALLVVTLRQTPNEAELILLPPDLGGQPNQVQSEVFSLETRIGTGGVERVCTVAFTAEAPGEYILPGLRFYLDGADGTVANFETDTFTLVVKEPIDEIWVVLAAAAVALALGFIAMRRYRQQQSATQSQGQTSYLERMQEKIHGARRYRLDGDFYRYFLSLSEAVEGSGANLDEQLAASLKERARQVGYQGLRPSDDELDSVMRDVEKAMRRFKEEQAV